jgi:hypothetical protein
MANSKSLVSHFGHRLLIVAALAGVVGCAERGIKQQPVYPVTGVILFGDKPAAGAIVCFHPQRESHGLTSHAEVAADGTFTLSTYVKSDGAREGEYVVTVFWPDVRSPHRLDEDDDSTELPPDRLKGRFANHRNTMLRATVGPDRVEFEPLDLQSAELQRPAEYHLRPKA